LFCFNEVATIFFSLIWTKPKRHHSQLQIAIQITRERNRKVHFSQKNVCFVVLYHKLLIFLNFKGKKSNSQSDRKSKRTRAQKSSSSESRDSVFVFHCNMHNYSVT
jgi:hypothetical protein